MILLLALGCPGPSERTTKAHTGETGADAVDSGDSDSLPGDSDSTPDSAPDSPTDSSDSVPDTDADTDTGVEAVVCDRTQPWIWVAAGMAQTCGIHADGCAECWGLGQEEGQLHQACEYCYYGEDKPPVGTYSRIEMFSDSGSWNGVLHTCGISDEDGLHCWGANYSGESDVAEVGTIDFAVGEELTYWIDAGGTVSGIGDDVALPPDDVYVDIAVGHGTAVVRKADGTTIQWPIHNEDPAWVKTLDRALDSVDIKSYGCGLATDSSIYCWSPYDPYVAFESPLATDSPTGTFRAVCVMSGESACALAADGTVDCWGIDLPYEIYSPPTDVTFTQVSCGSSHACGITGDGDLRCWGYDEFGETVTPT